VSFEPADRAFIGRAALEAARAEARKAKAEFDAKMTAIEQEMKDKLANAKDEGERQRIRAEAAAQKAQAAAVVHSKSHSSSSHSDKETTGVNKIKSPGKHEISDNPLEGL